MSATDGRLVLFGGPASAGKSTLARAWCETRPLAVHIQLDDIRSLIVGGLVNPQQTGDLQSQQFELSVKACCRLARTFLESGYDVAIDDVLFPEESFDSSWARYLDGLNYRMVIILPSLEETLYRARSRSKYVPEGLIRQQYEACLGWHEGLRINTTGLTIAESFALVENMINTSP